MTAIYCPHCGASSDDNSIQCNEEYSEFSIHTCYNCGKTHIRDVKPELLLLVRKEQNKQIDETAIRVKALCKYVMSIIAYERCEQKIKELSGGAITPPTVQETLKDDELNAALKRVKEIKAKLSKGEE